MTAIKNPNKLRTLVRSKKQGFFDVKAAIKYVVITEMKRMKHKKIEHLYLTTEGEDPIQLVDVLPTNERGVEKLDEIEELLYYITFESFI